MITSLGQSRGIPGYPGGRPRGSAGEAGPVPPRPLHLWALIAWPYLPETLREDGIVDNSRSANIPRDLLLSANEMWTEMWTERVTERGRDRWRHMSVAG